MALNVLICSRYAKEILVDDDTYVLDKLIHLVLLLVKALDELIELPDEQSNILATVRHNF